MPCGVSTPAARSRFARPIGAPSVAERSRSGGAVMGVPPALVSRGLLHARFAPHAALCSFSSLRPLDYRRPHHLRYIHCAAAPYDSSRRGYHAGAAPPFCVGRAGPNSPRDTLCRLRGSGSLPRAPLARMRALLAAEPSNLGFGGGLVPCRHAGYSYCIFVARPLSCGCVAGIKNGGSDKIGTPRKITTYAKVLALIRKIGMPSYSGICPRGIAT